ncbi:cytochrome P450 [Pilaira anomala]|nr:cytochrome P450 [Pilaira anomala]
MGTVVSYIVTIALTYILTQFGTSFIWTNKKTDGTPKSPWAPSPPNLPWFLNGYTQFNQDTYHTLTRWSKEIGEFFSVKIGQKQITVLNNVKLVHECLILKDQLNSSKAPSDTLEKFVTDHSKTVFTSVFSTYWARLRRAIYIVIGPAYLDQFNPLSQAQSEKLAFGIETALKQEENALNAKELRQLVELIAMDTALTIVVGDNVPRDPESMLLIIQKCRELEAKQTNHYNRLGQFFPSFNSFLDVANLFKLDNSMMNTRNALLEIFLPWFEPNLENRDHFKRSKEKLKSIATSLLSIEPSKNDPEPVQLVKEEVLVNLVHITLHAYTYLSSALFTLIQRLATEPELQSELFQESMQESASLAEAFVRESLRLDTPHPLLAYTPRADYELMVEDKPYRIDETSEIVVNINAIHQNPEYYPDPTKFDPKRYLKSEKKMTPLLEFGQTGRKVVKDTLAFGAGRRACLGSKVSERFLITALYQLVKTYELRGGNVKDKIDINTNIWSWTGRTETKGTTIKFIKK